MTLDIFISLLLILVTCAWYILLFWEGTVEFLLRITGSWSAHRRYKREAGYNKPRITYSGYNGVSGSDTVDKSQEMINALVKEIKNLHL